MLPITRGTAQPRLQQGLTCQAPARPPLALGATKHARHQTRHAAAAAKRNAGLYELDSTSGWGVEVVRSPAAQPRSAPSADSDAAAGASSSGQHGGGGADVAGGAAAAPQALQAKRSKKQGRTPFVELRSPEGVMGLTALQQTLAQREASGGGAAAARSAAAGVSAAKAGLAAAVAASGQAGRRKAVLPVTAAAAAAAMQQRQQRDDLAALDRHSRAASHAADVYDDGGDDGDDELLSIPQFQLTLSEAGAQLVEFDAAGVPLPRARRAGAASSADGDDELVSGAAAVEEFDQFGWEQFDLGEEEGEEGALEEAAQLVGSSGRAGARGRRAQAAPTAPAPVDDASLLRDLSNEDDWGLDGLPSRRRAGATGTAGGSLLAELERRAAAEEAAQDAGGMAAASVQWGGSGGVTGLDLEEQEALLARFFNQHKVAQLMAHQREADAQYKELKRVRAGATPTEQRLHSQLCIAGGSAAGRRLLSSAGAQTRPMMEKVRQAVFSMIQSRAGSVSALPKGSRWLDLFAGTGSVGLEALSRGAAAAHFVEMDAKVVKRVLGKNISSLGFSRAATVHTCKAEEFLRRAAALPRFAGGPFDFISVCPPYLLVSYPELYQLLDSSPLLHSGSIVLVEYPKQLRHEVRDTLGPLLKVRDRKYGRTYVALYAAARHGEEGDDSDEPADDPLLAMPAFS